MPSPTGKNVYQEFTKLQWKHALPKRVVTKHEIMAAVPLRK